MAVHFSELEKWQFPNPLASCVEDPRNRAFAWRATSPLSGGGKEQCYCAFARADTVADTTGRCAASAIACPSPLAMQA